MTAASPYWVLRSANSASVGILGLFAYSLSCSRGSSSYGGGGVHFKEFLAGEVYPAQDADVLVGNVVCRGFVVTDCGFD